MVGESLNGTERLAEAEPEGVDQALGELDALAEGDPVGDSVKRWVGDVDIEAVQPRRKEREASRIVISRSLHRRCDKIGSTESTVTE